MQRLIPSSQTNPLGADTRIARVNDRRGGIVETPWRSLRILFRAGAPEIFGRHRDRYGPRPAARCDIMGAKVKELHVSCASGKHWYVYALAVLPGKQTAGVGTSLLMQIAEMAAADGCPVYLEAAADNANYYRSRGFRVAKTVRMDPPPTPKRIDDPGVAAGYLDSKDQQEERGIEGHAMVLEGPVVISKVPRESPVVAHSQQRNEGAASS